MNSMNMQEHAAWEGNCSKPLGKTPDASLTNKYKFVNDLTCRACEGYSINDGHMILRKLMQAHTTDQMT